MCLVKNTYSHCKNGHVYTKENTYITPKGYRQCKACRLKYVEASNIKRGIIKKPKIEKMIPVKKKKTVFTSEQEKYIVENYDGFNGTRLAERFGVTVYYIDVIKKKYGLIKKGHKHSKRPHFNETDHVEIVRIVDIGRNGIFNVHAVENWVA